ncbi:hypothetical protein BWR15_19260 [Pseudomonas sp. T]|nr:hypothetical protein BWR15_19260 [Pseudomonas sp. T]
MSMESCSLNKARIDFLGIMDHVCRTHDPMVIAREGGESVVVLSLQDYSSLQETLYLFSSATNGARLRESLRELCRNNMFLSER